MIILVSKDGWNNYISVGDRLRGDTKPLLSFLGFVFFFFLGLFRAAPVVYGSFQPRGQIRAAAASLYHSHSHTRSEPHLQLTSQLTTTRILNPLSQARN